MPILARECDLYPENLLDESHNLIGDDRGWWALYTLSRREKELMRRLRALEIPFYGPIIERRTRSPAGRIQTAFVPLFPNYVFIFGDRATRYDALRTNCVARDLQVVDAERFVSDLRQIRKLIQTGLPLTPEAQLESGVPVRVKSGPLSGHRGTVIRRRGECRLLVSVQFLQQGASLEVDDCDLEILV